MRFKILAKRERERKREKERGREKVNKEVEKYFATQQVVVDVMQLTLISLPRHPVTLMHSRTGTVPRGCVAELDLKYDRVHP